MIISIGKQVEIIYFVEMIFNAILTINIYHLGILLMNDEINDML